ncbi:hypothetical protein ACQWKP_22890, partial [Salmonella enterica subsp. enterica serovar Infantis]
FCFLFSLLFLVFVFHFCFALVFFHFFIFTLFFFFLPLWGGFCGVVLSVIVFFVFKLLFYLLVVVLCLGGGRVPATRHPAPPVPAAPQLTVQTLHDNPPHARYPAEENTPQNRAIPAA